MRGGVTFDALGAPWELRFTTNALCRLEERAGKSLADVLADIDTPALRRITYRLLIWAGLRDVTLEQAGDIIDAIGPAETDRIVAAALRAAMPPQDGEPGNGAATAS